MIMRVGRLLDSLTTRLFLLQHALPASSGLLPKVIAILLGFLLLALVLNGLFLVSHDAPRITTDPIAKAPMQRDVAVGICQDTKTQITYVTTAQGGYYEASYDTPEIRYDLTWQRDGTTVAVEKLQGSQASLWAEQIGADFWNCVATRYHEIKQKQVAH